MVLRCSLLGHDYGEPDVEREREERGSEVVVTVQEYEECSRCGEKHVISENTEVTSLSAGTDDDAPHDDTDLPESTLETDALEDQPTSDAEFIDADAADDASADIADADAVEASEASAPETEPSAAAAADAADENELPTDENGDPVTDDGEILTDDASEPDRDRDHGEWPDSDDVGPPIGAESDPAKWPDERDSESDAGNGDLDPDENTDDAVVLENDPSADDRAGDGDGDRDGDGDGDGAARGATAAATDARSVTTSPATEDTTASGPGSTPDPGTGIERAQSAPTPTESASRSADNAPTEYYCPRCDFVAAGDRASLRAGDICPDCRKGYLSERKR
ncbi:DUF7093 family protein [Natrinema halophilum]|uniref:Uncharacterized protein n=1 Tax=Natrinema halophilum TaxID=1699371 RepID=A0A7D5KDI7_9EURY|nr:hypothetical protein [Natrinema halophilum]QLG49441.1 hypothetical protein HYG82_11490 [Natrinema halophilum]